MPPLALSQFLRRRTGRPGAPEMEYQQASARSSVPTPGGLHKFEESKMINLDRSSATPLYLQIYEHIRDEIARGELQEGYRLSATRKQAENIGVSRNTVELAYQQLCSEGYLENRRGSGYYVRPLDMSMIDSKSDFEKGIHSESRDTGNFIYDMRYGDCNENQFPLRLWRKAMNNALTELSYGRLRTYGEPCGEWKLRQQLAKYLEKSRGVVCSPEQIIIGSGTQQLIGMICQMLHPEKCAMEEPGYDGVRRVFENYNIEIQSIPVDEEGLDVERLKAGAGRRPGSGRDAGTAAIADTAVSGAGIGAVYVTPSHQFPMGAVMPIQKRIELLHAAEENDFYIIEDDYDSLYRYNSKAIPALQGLDNNDRVIYLGGLSKVLSPAVRMSYMVLPPELKNIYDRCFDEYHNPVSVLLQETVASLMEEGHWERHMRKMFLANRKKHDLLVEVLEENLGSGFTIRGKDAGLHLLVESDKYTSEEMILKIGEAGVRVYSPEKYFAERSSMNVIMIGYGGIDVKDIEDAADRIACALKIW